MVTRSAADTKRPALAGRARAEGKYGATAYFDGSGSLQSTFGLAPM